MSAPSQPMDAATAEVKRVVGLFRDMFGLCSDACRREPIMSIRRMEYFWSGKQVYTIRTGRDFNGERMQVPNAEAFPPGTSENLRKALNVYSMCTMSVIIYLPLLRKALQALGAQVSWHKVLIDSLIVLDFEGQALGTNCHHVFRIKTATGQEYIADFTVEQFGLLRPLVHGERQVCARVHR